VKTDPRDARKLARLHAGGLLESIAVPSKQVEALRDLVRAREDARLDRMRDRHRMSKFLLRHALRMPNKSWGVTRRRWLGSLAFERVHQQQAFQTYLHALDLVDRRIEHLETELDRAAIEGPWSELVARLRCMRGINTLTALGVVAEIGLDWSRFKTAEQFMSFVGLVPSERSSGEQRSQGSITKAGNTHVRRLLVEAAWHQRQRPRVGEKLAARHRGQDPLVLERAWRAQQRLHRRTRRVPEVQAGASVPQVQDQARPSVLVLHGLRASRPPDGRDDLPQVVHVAAPVVLRDVPRRRRSHSLWDLG